MNREKFRMDYSKKLKLLGWVYEILLFCFLLAYLYPLFWWVFNPEFTLMEFTKDWWRWYVIWTVALFSLDWFLTRNNYFMKA